MNIKLFKNRKYRLFVLGQAISTMGTVFINIALALYVLKVTGSATKFASILALEIIPKIILSPIIGTIVENLNRKKMIVYMDIIRAIFSVGLFFISFQYEINICIVYVIVLFYSSCQTFFRPASIKILPSILSKDDLIEGNSLQNTINQIVLMGTPILATLLFSISGIGVIFLIDGFTYFIGALSSASINIPLQQYKQHKLSFINDIVAGVKIVFSDIRITSLISNGVITHIFLFPFALVGFPYMIINLFGGQNIDYGFVQSVAPLGSIFAIFFVVITKKRYNIAQCIGIGIFSMILFVILMLPLLNDSLLISNQGNSSFIRVFFSITYFILNLSFSYYVVFYVSFYQTTIPDEFLSRYVSLQVLFFALGRMLGFKLYGYLFDNFSLTIPISVLCFGMILKLIIHIPFVKKQKVTDAQKIKCDY